MAKKDFGKRLMPEYLLKYSEDLLKNHPDPSAEWGGGADYTAGYGIEITNDEISVDQDVIASKSELSGYIKDDDLNYASTFRGKGVYVKEEGTYTATSYADGSIGRSIPHQPGYTYTLPDKTGTFAMTSDIITSYNDLTDKPTIPTKTSDLTNDSGFITGVAWNDVTGKPTFATVATSGDYDDLTNKPTIPAAQIQSDWNQTDSTKLDYIKNKPSIPVTTNFVTTDTAQTITGLKTIGQTSGSNSEVDFSGLTFKLVNKTINDSNLDLKLGSAWGGSYYHPNIYSSKGLFVNLAKIKLGNNGDNRYGITMPDSSTWGADRVLATTADIPTVPTRAEAPFLGVTQPSDGVMLFSLDGSAGSYSKVVEPQAEMHVNLQALDPNYGNGLTSSYNSSTKKLDVAIDTTTVAMKSDIPTVPTTATSTSTVTPTTETLTFTYSDNTTGTITFLTAVTVNTTTTLS